MIRILAHPAYDVSQTFGSTSPRASVLTHAVIPVLTRLSQDLERVRGHPLELVWNYIVPDQQKSRNLLGFKWLREWRRLLLNHLFNDLSSIPVKYNSGRTELPPLTSMHTHRQNTVLGSSCPLDTNYSPSKLSLA